MEDEKKKMPEKCSEHGSVKAANSSRRTEKRLTAAKRCETWSDGAQHWHGRFEAAARQNTLAAQTASNSRADEFVLNRIQTRRMWRHTYCTDEYPSFKLVEALSEASLLGFLHHFE
jgi:hypothetical protein